MLIPCPHCGQRPHSEFTYGGDATLRRPSDPALAADEEWLDYLYLRDNPRGLHREFWHHTLGCERWIEVRRDTLTHRIEGASATGARRGTRT
ncbi:MAG TPA: sarcosine oxidase subunit delta [Stellaceae bacterium]|nr:sarcosine oxidase subunit delta [Stellaceae bacterium]